ncbi:hypothetical protein Tco_0651416, partial [Tanacetum coccineum]
MAHYESQEFEDAICALSGFVGKPNLDDVKLMDILDRMVDERVQARAKSSVGSSSTGHDVLD